MNKTELVEAMAKEANLSKKDAEAALGAFTAVVEKALKRATRSPSLVSALLKSARELPASAAIPRPARKSKSPLPRPPLSSRARHSRTLFDFLIKTVTNIGQFPLGGCRIICPKQRWLP
jgi:DNA-binding protein HU-beta